MRSLNILGISAFYHDSAAALVKDGAIVAAAQEERFSRKKHDPRFPANAIRYCLQEAGLRNANGLDAVVFYDKPFLTFERLLMSYLTVAPQGLWSWLHAMPLWLSQKLHVPKLIEKELDYHGPVLFTEHHESHAASAFYPSPFQEAAILTIDGVGEWATASYGVGQDREITLFKELHFPDSLGLLYSAFTYFTGFRVNSGEYKLMGLAPYGSPRFVETILSELIDLKEDGSLRLNLNYFGFLSGLRMTNSRFEKLFEGPPRKPEGLITQREMDLAASIQKVTEEAMLRMARHVRRETNMANLCLAGGVALNCVGNGLILREGIFDRMWIQPAAGDAGGALGAALSAWHRYFDRDRPDPKGIDSQRGSFLGPHFSSADIEGYLSQHGYRFHRLAGEERSRRIAELLQSEKVVGYFRGKMEFGPRALGARSILGDARSDTIQSTLNLKIKFRESFRPFAPAVLEERACEYFEIQQPSPYMLLVAPVKSSRRLPQPSPDGMSLLDRLKIRRADIPAVTHLDYSARLQTVSQDTKADFYEVIGQFEKLTGCAVVVNTSFNVRGEPIVCTPEDAYRCFMRTDMDALVLEDCLLLKEEQPPWLEPREWKLDLQLD